MYTLGRAPCKEPEKGRRVDFRLTKQVGTGAVTLTASLSRGRHTGHLESGMMVGMNELLASLKFSGK